MKTTLLLFLTGVLFAGANAQDFLDVAGGNGLITNSGTTKLEILSKNAGSTAGIGLGDNNTVKSLVGYDGTSGLLKINNAANLGPNHLTIDNTGLIGINAAPGNARLFINHNSTSGLTGSAHIELQETGTSDFSRLKFTNTGSTALWTIAARSEVGNSIFNFFHNNGTDFANIMSLDGETFRVGIRETSPEAYLHIKQVSANVDALILENDDQTGSEKWGLRINNDDLEFRFEGTLRAYISSATGAYTAVPPPRVAALARQTRSSSEKRMLETFSHMDIRDPEAQKELEEQWPGLFYTVEGTDERQLDYSQLNVISLMGLKQQKELFETQSELLTDIDLKINELQKRLLSLEKSSNPK